MGNEKSRNIEETTGAPVNQELKEYTHKASKIQARPMTRGEYSDHNGRVLPLGCTPIDEGFLCVLGHGPEVWMSKESFLSKYVDDAGKISDGYHTFDELYNHRHLLWVNLLLANKDISFKTRRDFEGKEWEGWFIAGIQMPDKQITYHMPVAYWGILPDVKELERNFGFDGHTGQDVIDRLSEMALD